MKNTLLMTLLLVLLSNVSLLAGKPQTKVYGTNEITVTEDSIIINFGNNSKIVVYVANAKDKEKLKNLDVNALLRKIERKLNTIGEGATNVTIEEGDMKLKVYRQSNGNTTVVADTTKRKSKWNWNWDSDDDCDNDTNKKRSPKLIRSYFDLDLGLNTYVGNVSSNKLYELSPISSRYIALGFGIKVRLHKEKPLRLTTGFEFAWNNFMFENSNVRVYKDDTQTSFAESLVPQEKSKLVAAYLNVPLMLSYKSRETGLGISIGGYVGYRLDSYNAFVESGKDKQQAHASFYLNNIRHGIRVAADFKYITLFCNYDTSNLFQSGKAPELQTISFGVKLISGSF